MTQCPRSDVGPNYVIASQFVGILGVYPSRQEVIAVYPALSSTIIPHAQEIRFRRGDSFDLGVQMQDDYDPPNGVTLAQSVLRFAAKLGTGVTPFLSVLGNDVATVFKRSYDDSEIEITDDANGRAVIKIRRADTADHPVNPGYRWDLELTKPVRHIEGQPGTVQVLEGSTTVMGTGTAFQTAGLVPGDIIHVQGRHVLVVSIGSEELLETDFAGWDTDTGLDYNLYEARSRIVAGGPWECIADAVT